MPVAHSFTQILRCGERFCQQTRFEIPYFIRIYVTDHGVLKKSAFEGIIEDSLHAIATLSHATSRSEENV